MSRNGWGASAVDALSTALVMRNKDVVNEILDYVPTIDWSVSYQDSRVSLFETTIRYMGGLLSAYDLLQGPLNYIVRNVRSQLCRILSADTGLLINKNSQKMFRPYSAKPGILPTT
jgi:mannosyl-oligosaccharide alpha-1,2-mannosidase